MELIFIKITKIGKIIVWTGEGNNNPFNTVTTMEELEIDITTQDRTIKDGHMVIITIIINSSNLMNRIGMAVNKLITNNIKINRINSIRTIYNTIMTITKTLFQIKTIKIKEILNGIY